MGKYLNQLTVKMREGEYDERLEELFDVTLVLAVLIFLAAFGIILQLGCFEDCSEALKPAPSIEWPVFPNEALTLLTYAWSHCHALRAKI
jgi:hypothetical protein